MRRLRGSLRRITGLIWVACCVDAWVGLVSQVILDGCKRVCNRDCSYS